MKRIVQLVLLATFAAPSLSMRAAVISHDWKTPGDGLTTFDTVNQREWLDVSQTRLSQFPGVTNEAKYQYVVTQTMPGALFDGFTPGKSGDVLALLQSAGVDTTTLDRATNFNATQAFLALFGFTSPGPGYLGASAFLDETTTSSFNFRVGALIRANPTQAGIQITSNNDILTDPYPPGVLLFRAVPEPTTCLSALAMTWTFLLGVNFEKAG